MVFTKDLWQDISTRSRIRYPHRKIQILPLPLIPNGNLPVPATSLGDKRHVRLVPKRRRCYVLLETRSFVDNRIRGSAEPKPSRMHTILKIVAGSRLISTAFYQLIRVIALWLLSVGVGKWLAGWFFHSFFIGVGHFSFDEVVGGWWVMSGVVHYGRMMKSFLAEPNKCWAFL